MPTVFDNLLKLSVGMAETGLLMVQSAATTAQSSIENLAGIRRLPPTRPPLDGPTNVDDAISEVANRLARIARFTVFDPTDIPKAWNRLLEAVRFSFAYVDPRDARTLILPLQVPLSITRLVATAGRLGLALLDVRGIRGFRPSLGFFFEFLTEVQVYAGLQYREVIEGYQARLAEAPDDHATRLELGRTLIKCGRYEEAAGCLRQAAEAPGIRASALHECAVALYRAGRYREAAEAGSEAVSVNSSHDRARAWLWLCAQELGGYPEFVPEANRMEAKAGRAPASVKFEDIASKIGLDKTSAGRGTAIIDYNNDGYLDVVFTASHGGCSLYRNNGNGTFTDVSVGSGLETSLNNFSVTAGDYNNDGYTDLFITRLGFYYGESELWRNNGDGTFTNVTKDAGVSCWSPCFSPSWVDYDCDGNLDLFVPNNVGGFFDRMAPHRLFHNNGDGTFTEVAEQAGIRTIWPTIGSAWGDYDNDGYPDLFVSGPGRPHLFHNNGDGTFTDVSLEAGFEEFCWAFGAYFCDIDNDGWLDIVQLSWSDHEDVIHSLRYGEGPPGAKPMRIYRNNRDGTFSLVTHEYGIAECWGTMSGNAGDFNNDGWLDFVLGNGAPRMDRLEPLVLLEGDGQKYRNVTFSAGLPPVGKSHGVNFADLFGDGRLSILVGAGGAYPGELITASLWCPKTLPGNYLNVRLVGTKSNRSALGARLKLLAGGREQHRVVNGGSNFGCLPMEQHFGLGRLASIEGIEIRWPSGLVQRFETLPINDSISITEGETTWRHVYRRDVSGEQSAEPVAQKA